MLFEDDLTGFWLRFFLKFFLRFAKFKFSDWWFSIDGKK